MSFSPTALLSCLTCLPKSHCMPSTKNVVWSKLLTICNFSEKDMYGDSIKDSNLVCTSFSYKKKNEFNPWCISTNCSSKYLSFKAESGTNVLSLHIWIYKQCLTRAWIHISGSQVHRAPASVVPILRWRILNALSGWFIAFSSSSPSSAQSMMVSRTSTKRI